MTTIVWDGFMIAADGQCTSGSTVVDSQAKKIIDLTKGPTALWFRGQLVQHLALAGTTGDEHVIVAEILKDQWDPNYSFHKEMSFIAALFLDNGEAYIIHKNRDDELSATYRKDPPLAIGSGRDFALAALYFGATAKDAVACAVAHDVYTGGHIQSVQFGGSND